MVKSWAVSISLAEERKAKALDGIVRANIYSKVGRHEKAVKSWALFTSLAEE